MFIKIRWFKVKKLEDKTVVYNELCREMCYECVKYSIGPEKVPPGEDVKDILLVVDVGKQDERTINFPAESDDEVTEVYVMNNSGRTVDKYVY